MRFKASVVAAEISWAPAGVVIRVAFFFIHGPNINSYGRNLSRTSKRILILAVVVSLVSHLVMLMVTGLMIADIENEGSPVLTVELKDLIEISENNHPEKNEAKPAPPPEEERRPLRPCWRILSI